MDGKLEILPGEGLVDGSEKSGWEGGLDLKIISLAFNFNLDQYVLTLKEVGMENLAVFKPFTP